MEIISMFKRNHIDLAVVGTKLRFSPMRLVSEEMRRELIAHKDEIIALLEIEQSFKKMAAKNSDPQSNELRTELRITKPASVQGQELEPWWEHEAIKKRLLDEAEQNMPEEGGDA